MLVRLPYPDSIAVTGVTWNTATAQNSAFASGNKQVSKSGSSAAAGIATQGVSAGQKRYWEVQYLSTTSSDFSGNGGNGWFRSGGTRGNFPATQRNGYLGGGDNWAVLENGTVTQSNNEQGYNFSIGSFSTGSVIGFIVDYTGNTWSVNINGSSWVGNVPLPTNDGTIYPAYQFDASCSSNAMFIGRFAAADQTYSPPSGYTAFS